MNIDFKRDNFRFNLRASAVILDDNSNLSSITVNNNQVIKLGEISINKTLTD